jgi:hypothetical protein
MHLTLFLFLFHQAKNIHHMNCIWLSNPIQMSLVLNRGMKADARPIVGSSEVCNIIV